jgi:hypothetical protein
MLIYRPDPILEFDPAPEGIIELFRLIKPIGPGRGRRRHARVANAARNLTITERLVGR